MVCVAAALDRRGIDPPLLSRDRPALRLKGRAVTESFTARRGHGVARLPRNLGVLHRRFLTPIAVRYWARTMRMPTGNCSLRRTRATPESRFALGADVLARIMVTTEPAVLRHLLETW